MGYDVEIATDGSCIQSGAYRSGSKEEARPGAWAFVARLSDGQIIKRAAPLPDTTIGAMEVAGLLNALEFATATDAATVLIQCDSQYVVNGYNDWIEGWASKNFHKKGGLSHADQWRRIHALKAELARRVTVQWIKAHQNLGSLNDDADELANRCARTQQAVDIAA